MAVLVIDLDGFKPINDRLGHAAGDEVPRIVALRLLRATRRHDFVCRVGGDEFLWVLRDVPDAACAQTIARHLLQRIAAPFDVGGEEMMLRASIGVAVHRLEGADLALPAHGADGAIYSAKARALSLPAA